MVIDGDILAVEYEVKQINKYIYFSNLNQNYYCKNSGLGSRLLNSIYDFS